MATTVVDYEQDVPWCHLRREPIQVFGKYHLSHPGLFIEPISKTALPGVTSAKALGSGGATDIERQDMTRPACVYSKCDGDTRLVFRMSFRRTAGDCASGRAVVTESRLVHVEDVVGWI